MDAGYIPGEKYISSWRDGREHLQMLRHIAEEVGAPSRRSILPRPGQCCGAERRKITDASGGRVEHHGFPISLQAGSICSGICIYTVERSWIVTVWSILLRIASRSEACRSVITPSRLFDADSARGDDHRETCERRILNGHYIITMG